jgi:hypothetical protein
VKKQHSHSRIVVREVLNSWIPKLAFAHYRYHDLCNWQYTIYLSWISHAVDHPHILWNKSNFCAASCTEASKRLVQTSQFGASLRILMVGNICYRHIFLIFSWFIIFVSFSTKLMAIPGGACSPVSSWAPCYSQLSHGQNMVYGLRSSDHSWDSEIFGDCNSLSPSRKVYDPSLDSLTTYNVRSPR